MNLIHSNSPCQRVRPLLDSYVSNELLIETNHDILRHVGDCPQCRTALQEIEGTRIAVRRAVRSIHPPADLRERICASLTPREAAWTGSLRPRLAAPHVMSRWMAVAAALTAVVLSVGILRNLTLHRNSTGLLHVGWMDHKECVQAGHLPARPPTREQAVTRLASHSGLLGVVEAEMPGYVLRQAHECTVAGRKYIHLAMAKGGHIVSVSLVRKNPGERLPAPKSATIEGVEVFGFDSGDYLGFVMGEVSKDLPGLATKLTPRIQQVMQTL
ncbi:MAG: hypothetical protein HY820_07290 [Acidobacteria bacterium]|nr:hypothetical protein [Acidobacteriota bacterium]